MFYKMICADSEFDMTIISFIKETICLFLKEKDSQFLRNQLGIVKYDVEELKIQIHNNQDPSDDFLRLINLVFEQNFSIYY
jgi:hypothetical protein